MTHAIPPGFERCPVCGEFNGTTRAKYLTWVTEPPARVGKYIIPAAARNLLRETKREKESRRDPEELISVMCLCHGPLCNSCKVNRVPRPISNSYNQYSNTVGHWFYLIGLAPCSECRAKEQSAGSSG